ncbi:MAG: hypothetical protein RI955_115 [Bacteroidota bacterium]|jgi:phosphoglycerol transferase MdoB-like AlkP superfamily enzyme
MLTKETYNLYFNLLLKLTLQWLWLIILFGLCRILLLIQFGNFDELINYKLDIFFMFIKAIRFDSYIILYALLPPFFFATFGIVILLFKKEYFLLINKLNIAYYHLISFLSIVFLLIDFFYFSFFHTQINIIAFGLIEDDTQAILTSVISDFPILKITIMLIFIALANAWIINKINSISYSFVLKLPAAILFFLLFNTMYFLGLRGSIQDLPLNLTQDGAISTNKFLNDILPNGIFTFKEALHTKLMYQFNTNESKMLATYGFENKNELIQKNISIANNNTDSSFFSTTSLDTFLQNHPPNVVFIQMESMGSDVMSYHSTELNLMGTLEEVLPKCIWYKNFTCGGILTIHSTEQLMVNTLMTPLTHSKYSLLPFNSSIALPFNNAGYETQFITGGSLTWNNLNRFLTSQGFQQVKGNYHIKDKFENSFKQEWGIADEYLFSFVLDELKHNNKKSKFIYCMTVSNHTPFDIPTNYKPFTLNYNLIPNKRQTCNSTFLKKNLTSFQYANDCLGKFLKQILNSPLADNTIVAITGDHFCHGLFNYSMAEDFKHFGVPFILYIPQKYKRNIKIDADRFGSHKDIFPTLFNLSLSNAKYFNSGNNLLSENDSIEYFGFTKYSVGDQNYVAFNKFGRIIGPQLNMSNWNNDLLIETEKDNYGHLKKLQQLANIHAACMDENIIQQINKK